MRCLDRLPHSEFVLYPGMLRHTHTYATAATFTRLHFHDLNPTPPPNLAVLEVSGEFPGNDAFHELEFRSCSALLGYGISQGGVCR